MVNTWDEFKQLWLRKYTLWGTDLKYRRHFYQVKQETEDVEKYLEEFFRRKSYIVDPSDQEVFTTFIEGLDPKIQQYLHEEQVTTLDHAVRRTI